MTDNIEDTQPRDRSESNAPTVPISELTLPAAEPAPEPPPAPPPSRPARSGMGRPVDYWLLWLVALGSIALNVWLINTLLTIQRDLEASRLELAQGIAEAANGVGQVQLGTIDYEVVIDETIPVNIKVPISDTFHVSISETIPYSGTAYSPPLPVLGVVPFSYADEVPINLDIVVPISSTYLVSDTVPVRFTVPVQVNLDETPLGDLKGELQGYLIELANELQQPSP
jgi:hypothetical protein